MLYYQQGAADTLRKAILREHLAMKDEAVTFIPHWQELSRFVQPRKGRFLITDRDGGKRYREIINSVGNQSLKVARAGLLAGVMSPARPWFALETPDPDMMKRHQVRVWLNTVAYIMRAVLNGSNFYSMAGNYLAELLTFGTAVMSHVDDFEDVARFYTHTCGSYVLSQDDRLVVNKMAREYEWPVARIVRRFGIQNVSQKIKDAYDKSNYQIHYPIVHFVGPNDEFKPEHKMSRFKKFASIYVEPGIDREDKVLERKGFDEFPAHPARWEVTEGDVYGTDCPAISALGDIKGVQLTEKRKAQALDKMTDPPLQGPPGMKSKRPNGLPGGFTTVDSGDNRKIESLYQINLPIQEVRLDIQEIERRVKDHFHVPLFLAITEMEGIQPRNQLDLMQRNEERLLQLGPVLEQIHGEFAGPVIDRLFNQCLRAGIFPDPPEELFGQNLRAEFISTLAQAQRAVAASTINRLVTFIAGLSSAGFRSATDKVDSDFLVEEYNSVIGGNPRNIVPQEIATEQREERAMQQRQAQAMQAAEQGAGITKTLSDAKTGDDSALTGLQQVANARA